MEYATAPPASRGTSLTIQWGLMSIPVEVSKTVAPIKTVPARSSFTPEGDPVGSKSYNKTTGADYEGEKVGMTKAGDGWVELTDEEIGALIDEETLGKGLAKVISILPVDAIGQEYHVTSCDHVRPAKRKDGRTKVADPAANAAFALFTAALAKTNSAALIMYSGYKGVVKPAAIMPNGDFVELAFAAEVRPRPAMPEATFSDVELDMAVKLLEAMGSERPVLVDTIGTKISEYVAAKAAGGVTKPKEIEVKEITATVDLQSALAASLEAMAS